MTIFQKINKKPCSVPYPTYLRYLLKKLFEENYKNHTVATWWSLSEISAENINEIDPLGRSS